MKRSRTAQEQARHRVDRRAITAARAHAVRPRRGWLVAARCSSADLVGLMLAFTSPSSFSAGRAGRLEPAGEIGLFVRALPFFVVAAKLQGLYDHDEERTDHTTADDLVGVFHLVTVGHLAVLRDDRTSRPRRLPSVERLSLFWALSIALVTLVRAAARALCRRQPQLPPEHDHRRRRRRRPAASRARSSQHPEYGIEPRRLRRPHPKQRRASSATCSCSAARATCRALVQLLDVERVIFAFSNEPD